MATVTSLTEAKITELMAGWQGVSLSQDEINALVQQLWNNNASQDVILTDFKEVVVPTLEADLAANAISVADLNTNVLPGMDLLLDQHELNLTNLNTVDIPSLQGQIDSNFAWIDELNTITLPALNLRLDANDAALNDLNTVTLPGLDSRLDAVESGGGFDPTALQAEVDALELKFPITGPDIAADSITANHIGADQITASEIAARTITALEIAVDAITANEIAADSITASEIAARTITALEIAVDAITANEIAADSITASEIAARTITALEIAADTITANEVAADSITASEIAARTITALEIAVDTITANEIAADSITASEIAAKTITAAEIAGRTITALEIKADTITANEVAADSITASEIAALTITAAEIAANAIVAAKLESTLVLTTRLVAGSPLGTRVEMNSSGLFAYSGTTQTFGVDAATGVVSVTGDLFTDVYGLPRLQLQDYVAAGLQGATKVRMNPGENTVTNWDHAEPGSLTHWTNTTDGNNGFFIEMVTADPTSYERGRFRVVSARAGNSGRGELLGFGDLIMYSSFTGTSYSVLSPNESFWQGPGGGQTWWQDGFFQWKTPGTDGARINNVGSSAEFRTNAGINANTTTAYGTVRMLSSETLFGWNIPTVGSAETRYHGFQAPLGAPLKLLSFSADGIECLNANGTNWRKITALSFVVGSDRRAKKNIKEPEAQALDILRQAPVYEYDYKEDVAEEGGLRRIGPMADDLPEYLSPALGEGATHEGLRTMDLAQMVGVLMQAVQELDVELDAWRKTAKPNRKDRTFTEKALPQRKKPAKKDVPELERPPEFVIGEDGSSTLKMEGN